MQKILKYIALLFVGSFLAFIYFESAKNEGLNRTTFNKCEDAPENFQAMCDVERYFANFIGDKFLLLYLDSTINGKSNENVPNEIFLLGDRRVLSRAFDDSKLWMGIEEGEAKIQTTSFDGLFNEKILYRIKISDSLINFVIEERDYENDLDKIYKELFENGIVDVNFDIYQVHSTNKIDTREEVEFKFLKATGFSESYSLIENDILNINGISYEVSIIRNDYEDEYHKKLIDYYWYSKELKTILKLETFSVESNALVNQYQVNTIHYSDIE